MPDEHALNEEIADAIKKRKRSYFEYRVWQTDHPFTNKRGSLISKIRAFLER